MASWTLTVRGCGVTEQSWCKTIVSENKCLHLSTASCAPVNVADVGRVLERAWRVERQGCGPTVANVVLNHYTNGIEIYEERTCKLSSSRSPCCPSQRRLGSEAEAHTARRAQIAFLPKRDLQLTSTAVVGAI